MSLVFLENSTHSDTVSIWDFCQRPGRDFGILLFFFFNFLFTLLKTSYIENNGRTYFLLLNYRFSQLSSGHRQVFCEKTVAKSQWTQFPKIIFTAVLSQVAAKSWNAHVQLRLHLGINNDMKFYDTEVWRWLVLSWEFETFLDSLKISFCIPHYLHFPLSVQQNSTAVLRKLC